MSVSSCHPKGNKLLYTSPHPSGVASIVISRIEIESSLHFEVVFLHIFFCVHASEARRADKIFTFVRYFFQSDEKMTFMAFVAEKKEKYCAKYLPKKN